MLGFKGLGLGSFAGYEGGENWMSRLIVVISAVGGVRGYPC